MDKDFDSWNSLKKKIDKKVIDKDLYFHEREIWWCSLGLNVGVESNGKNTLFERPILILKVFNADMIWCLPITSSPKESLFYYRLNDNDGFGSIITSQIKTISSKRLLRKMSVISEFDFVEIQKVIINHIKNENPFRGNLGGRSH